MSSTASPSWTSRLRRSSATSSASATARTRRPPSASGPAGAASPAPARWCRRPARSARARTSRGVLCAPPAPAAHRPRRPRPRRGDAARTPLPRRGPAAGDRGGAARGRGGRAPRRGPARPARPGGGGGVRRATAGLAALCLGAVALGAPASAQEAARPPAKTRVYVVVVDGLRPDEVAQMPFLSSLAAGGASYPESRAIMVAETIPNHVAMVTGNYADRNGIVANDFPDTTDDTTKGNEPVRLPRERLAVHAGRAAVPPAGDGRRHQQGLPVRRDGPRPDGRRRGRRRQQLRQHVRPDLHPRLRADPGRADDRGGAAGQPRGRPRLPVRQPRVGRPGRARRRERRADDAAAHRERAAGPPRAGREHRHLPARVRAVAAAGRPLGQHEADRHGRPLDGLVACRRRRSRSPRCSRPTR